MAEHARLSPSGAEKWMTCPGSVALEADEPDTSNDYSDEGTAAHFLASECLVTNTDAEGFAGQHIGVLNGRAEWVSVFGEYQGKRFLVDDDMAMHVQTYVDKVREYADGGTLLVEQRMSISHLTGEENAAGTADAVILQGDEIIIADLKYGMREVDGDRNKQMMVYALAALREYELLGDFTTVRTVIIQPRIGHYPEWSCTVAELKDFGLEVTGAANTAHQAHDMYHVQRAEITGFLVPGAHCQKNYCKARAKCPALSKFVTDSVESDFEEIVEYKDIPVYAETVALGTLMSAVPLIEDWCKAVRAKVEAELFSGRAVPGYKIVQGKKGNRQWSDKDQAEATMKGFKLKVEEMYDLKLISPTTAEKLAKSKVIGPRQWPKLNDLVTQSEGAPSVAPESDKRPAIDVRPTADDFEDIAFEDMI